MTMDNGQKPPKIKHYWTKLTTEKKMQTKPPPTKKAKTKLPEPQCT